MKTQPFLFLFTLFALTNSVFAQPAIVGATSAGGITGVGIMFRIDTSAAAVFTDLHDFTYQTSINPEGSLMQATDGNIYGFAHTGGAVTGDSGALFNYTLATSTYTVLHYFTKATGFHPTGSLIEVNGILYGMTPYGGTKDSGVIFKYNLVSQTYTVIYNFTKATGSCPNGTLVFNKGVLYGMTNNGGAKDSGVIFSIDTATLTYNDCYDLNSKSGGFPYGNLIITPSGKFLALTSAGGAHDSGTVILYNPLSKTVTDEHDFNDSAGGIPAGNLIWGGSNLYGLTSSGGANDSGVVFSLNPVTYAYSKLFDFTKDSGVFPKGSLLLANNGDLYGMASGGGTKNFGTLFRIDTTNFTFKKLFSFTGTANGRLPVFTQLIEICIPPVITKQAANAHTCAGADTSFTIAATAGDSVIYQWEVNKGSGFTTVTNTGVYSGAASQSLKITGATMAMNNYVYRCVTTNGCTSNSITNSDTLFVDSVTVMITGNVKGGFKVCTGFIDTLKTKTTGNSLAYKWSTGGTNDTALVKTQGIYSVIVNDKYGCADTASDSVTVFPKPTITITSSSKNDTLCKGDSITLKGNGALSYSWNNGVTNGVAFAPFAPGTFVVTGTDSNGCKNNDTVNVDVIICTGINELKVESGKLKVYPNPNNGMFTIQMENGKWKMENEKTQVEIYNVLGEKVYSQFSIFNSQFSIDISNQPSGIYLYRAISEKGGIIATGKIIIE